MRDHQQMAPSREEEASLCLLALPAAMVGAVTAAIDYTVGHAIEPTNPWRDPTFAV